MSACVHVREAIPNQVLRGADEITIVDITPRALVNRLQRRDIHAPKKIRGVPAATLNVSLVATGASLTGRIVMVKLCAPPVSAPPPAVPPLSCKRTVTVAVPLALEAGV